MLVISWEIYIHQIFSWICFCLQYFIKNCQAILAVMSINGINTSKTRFRPFYSTFKYHRNMVASNMHFWHQMWTNLNEIWQSYGWSMLAGKHITLFPILIVFSFSTIILKEVDIHHVTRYLSVIFIRRDYYHYVVCVAHMVQIILKS